MITISDKAADKLRALMAEGGYGPEHFLRVGVKGGGCSGLSYKMDFDDKVTERDEVFEHSGIRVVCDKPSLLYLFGTVLEYSDGLNGRGFVWNNPQASRVCGCGESFAV
jgi:iron-sulfur cluster assembly protein